MQPPERSLVKPRSTLVVVMGSHRGGEQVWTSLERNVLVPLKADLAVLASFDQVPNSLTERAQHLWRVREFSDWGEPIAARYGTDWRSNVSLTENLWGGIRRDPSSEVELKGSGGILLVLRMVLLSYLDALEGYPYKTVILTRADLYHTCAHPQLTVADDEWYAPEGGGGAPLP